MKSNEISFTTVTTARFQIETKSVVCWNFQKLFTIVTVVHLGNFLDENLGKSIREKKTDQAEFVFFVFMLFLLASRHANISFVTSCGMVEHVWFGYLGHRYVNCISLTKDFLSGTPKQWPTDTDRGVKNSHEFRRSPNRKEILGLWTDGILINKLAIFLLLNKCGNLLRHTVFPSSYAITIASV